MSGEPGVNQGGLWNYGDPVLNQSATPESSNTQQPAASISHNSTSCPYCARQLPTSLARQCFSCGKDWRNPNQIIQHPTSHQLQLEKAAFIPLRVQKFFLLAGVCALSQVLVLMFLAAVFQFPMGIVPALLFGVPLAAMLLNTESEEASTGLLSGRIGPRWLLLLFSALSLAFPVFLAWAAASAFLTAILYYMAAVYRLTRLQTLLPEPAVAHSTLEENSNVSHRPAFSIWALLFSLAMFALFFFQAPRAAVAAVVLIFCLAETILLMRRLSTMARRSIRRSG